MQRAGGATPESFSLAYPDVVTVEVTSVCNLRCKMCILTTRGAGTSASSSHMPATTWEKVLEFAPLVGSINFSGWGECFTHPDFLDMIKDLDRMGVPTSYNTNGTCLTRDAVYRLAGMKYIYGISVSVDSPDPLIYRDIRGVELERVLQGIRLLATELPRPELVAVSSVIMAGNAGSLRSMPALLEQLGIRRYVLQGLVDVDGAILSERLERGPALRDCVEAIHRECEERSILCYLQPNLHALVYDHSTNIWGEMPADLIRARNESEDPPGETRMCLSSWDHVFLDRDGNVRPCCCSPMWECGDCGELPLMGNVNEESFDRIWRGERFSRFRSMILDGPPPSICKECIVASTGPHFFRLYQAEIDFGASRTRGDRLHVVVKNTGLAAWTRDTGLAIGTSKPRDHQSLLHHETWLSENRVAGFEEERVEPGGRANFHMKVSTEASGGVNDVFQLLAENICWLRDTQFEVQVNTGRPGCPKARIVPWPHREGSTRRVGRQRFGIPW